MNRAFTECLRELRCALARLAAALPLKLIEHKTHIDKHGLDLPEVRNWKWPDDEDRKE